MARFIGGVATCGGEVFLDRSDSVIDISVCKMQFRTVMFHITSIGLSLIWIGASEYEAHNTGVLSIMWSTEEQIFYTVSLINENLKNHHIEHHEGA